MSQAFGINYWGQIVGWATTEDDKTHAFLYDSSGMTDLGTLGGTRSEAFSINDWGQVVGRASTKEDATHAFLYDSSGMTDLGTLGGTWSEAYAINNAGLVVGRASTKEDATHAFLYDSSGMIDLGTLGGTFSHAFSINNAGLVVGVADTPSTSLHAFLYDNGSGMTNLNTLIDPGAGWILTEARDINDDGWIVGTGIHNGATRAFLLTPISVPEPGSWVLVLLGFAMLALVPRLRAA